MPIPVLNILPTTTPKRITKVISRTGVLPRDSRGIIYAANHSGGVLEYDGVYWRKTPVPNYTVRSLAIDETGTIYVGGVNEIGYLAPNPKGLLKYNSLRMHLKENHRNFSNVWNTHAAPEGIYFLTSKYLFRWNPDQKVMKVWQPTGKRFNNTFLCRGKFYIHQRQVGLMHIENDKLQPVPGIETFASVKIYMMAPYQKDKLLIGTRSNSFFIYDGKTTRPFLTEADQYLKQNQLYHGIRLSSSPGGFALATRKGGLVIIDPGGRLKKIYSRATVLQDNSVKYIFEDSGGNIWLALNKGISKIEYASPISTMDHRYGLKSQVMSVIRHHDKLYAATYNGLFSMDNSGKFKPTAGLSSTSWWLLSADDSLLVATTHGVFQVDNNSKHQVTSNAAHILLRSRKKTNRIWAGTIQGLTSLYRENKDEPWKIEHEFKLINGNVRTIVEEQDGSLWLGLRGRGVIKVNFPAAQGTVPDNASITRYDSSHGLPPETVRVFKAAGHVIFTTLKGLFRFDETKNRFIPDTTLGKQYAGGGNPVFRIKEDMKGNIWFHSDKKNFQAIPTPSTLRPSGNYNIQSKPFRRITRFQVNSIYPDGPFIRFASVNGLVSYDTRIKKDYIDDFPALIRTVQLINASETLFGGHPHRHVRRKSFTFYL